MSFPEYGRTLWFERAFIIGHGPRLIVGDVVGAGFKGMSTNALRADDVGERAVVVWCRMGEGDGVGRSP